MKNIIVNKFKQIVFCLFITVMVGCSDDEHVPMTPTADFSAEMNELDVSFTSNTSYAVALEWDFGDGETSTKVNPTHTYASEGDYSVVLKAIGEVGTSTEVATRTITVEQTNPTANFTYEVDNTTITFINTSERAVSYTWDFGDGETSTEENPVHTYAEAGEYSVTLTTIGVVDGSIPATYTTTVAAAVAVFASIAVENGDFSLPGDAKYSNWENIPGWNSDTQAADSGVEAPAEDGNVVAYKMSSDPSVYNLTDHIIAAGEEFKVNVEASDAWNSSQFIVTLYYDNGDGTRNVLATQTFDLSSEEPFELTTMATEASVGANLGIEFDNISTDGGDGWTQFDNVQLFVK
ncbi:PKD domain-containing protein [Gramella sp. AN32]|uniref:PKD domain-containing protein n=1 Tax=Christiangramia antarctica TaxID=2058158 RepID=A0ABW5X8T2_9FLAO|nr:PKD domain-containing protein [Gramella sp. AN32]MCM4157286.1 hypothetical protein [Gramella sp. AN32]